ncbi:hypothetical protein HY497_02115 [Candidatus Woesearchaeota archaeon]|nr:hypothetical protein [Candidatus Woesearchaeota archaeon]
MHDKTLLRVALLVSIIGMVLLFFISSQLSAGEQTISQLDELPEGKEIKVTGVVLRVNDAENVVFLDIAEEKIEDVTVVLFKDGKVDVKEGDVVTVVGSLEEYEGKKEIIGNRVEVK